MKSNTIRPFLFASLILVSAQLSALEDKSSPEEETAIGLDCQPYPQCDIDKQDYVTSSKRAPEPETFWSKLANEITAMLQGEQKQNAPK